MQHRSFWLQEALGDAPDQPPLEGAARADIAIMGGGFVGLWTAIRIKERDPGCDVVVLEQDVCGGGASGRNGGEVLSWWAKAGKLVDLCGREEAIRIGKASVDAIGEIEEFCKAHGIDAEFNRGGYLWTATTEAQLGAWDSTVELLRDLGAPALELLEPAEVARRAGSPIVTSPACSTRAPRPSSPPSSPAACAASRSSWACASTSTRRVTDLDRRSPAVLRTADGVLTADRVVIATNAWAASMRELHTRLVVISSDIILTEEAPDRLAEIGWTGYEAISDSQVMIHYYRRTPTGRVMFGKGGWGIAMAGAAAGELRPPQGRARDVEANFRRIYPTLAGVKVEHDWSGPIDRAYHGLPIFGRLGGREHLVYGVGWSGNGVGPSVLGGKILASLALGERDEWSQSPFVGERSGRFPPEPVRFTGAHVVRSAVVRMERSFAEGREPRPWDTFVAGFAPAGIIPKKTKGD